MVELNTRPLLKAEGAELSGRPVPGGEEDIEYCYDFGLRAAGKKRSTADGITEVFWRLHNDGQTVSPPVTDFRPLSLDIPCQGRLVPRIHSSSGGLNSPLFPPTSWVQRSHRIPIGGLWGLRFSSEGGRSSNRDFPFFVIENPPFMEEGGLVIALGWSGNWELLMDRDKNHITVRGGIPGMNLRILPGESFLQPTVLLGRYRGGAEKGFALLRTHIRDYVQPKLGGNPVSPLSSFDNYYGDGGIFNEETYLNEIPLAEEAGIEYLVVDGGWNGGGEDGLWESIPPHVGNWRPDPNKFPQGFGKIKEMAHKHNRKLGLWFDIERSHTYALAYQDHPELFFPSPVDNNGECHLVRLDLEAGLNWITETIERNIADLGAKWLRLDFNMDPAGIWEANDIPERKGATELRYIENLYRHYDRILQKHPDIAIENCASGGRRIDLETLRRSHTNWISDHTQSETIVRYHIHGAGKWLPANQLNNSYAHKFWEPNRAADWTKPQPASAYLSYFGGSFSLSDRLQDMSPEARKTVRFYIDLFYKTAPCFQGDVTAIGRQEDAWEGPWGIAGKDPLTGRRALLLFGIGKEKAGAWAPGDFEDLVTCEPAAGDGGDEQFIKSYLWFDERG
jgi:alpha-galactosidase